MSASSPNLKPPSHEADGTLSQIIERVRGKRNIELSKWQQKSWDAEHMEASLKEMLAYAESNARVAMDWYWDKKGLKANLSRIGRLGAILFTAASAMIPIFGSTGWWKPTNVDAASWTLKVNQAGYLSLGFAALALALDRYMSGSASWMRYVSTATSIHTALEQLRFDWEKLRVPLAGKAPSPQEAIPFINRIDEFNATVRGLVEAETKAWVADFQQNLAELEKSTAAALQTARSNAQAAQKAANDDQKAAQQRAEEERKAALPGGIELTVENAAETDQGYDVLVDSNAKKTSEPNSICAVLDVSPGLHEVIIQAKIGGIPASASAGVIVTSNAISKVHLRLAKIKTAGQNP